MDTRAGSLDRRELLKFLGVGGGAYLASGLVSYPAFADAHKDILVLGIDFSDITGLDPARDIHYTGPLIVSAAYETLVTMVPGDYINPKPALATGWERTPDGKGWRIHLRENVKFATGNPMTADDAVYSLNRVRYVQDQPSQYLSNVVSIDKVDDKTIDIVLKDSSEPIMTILTAPAFAVLDSKVLAQHDGSAAPDAKQKDKASQWLNQNSIGTGPYKITHWERNSQIVLTANPGYWGAKVPFQRVIVRHFDDGAAQLLALKQGDIDAAFNLIPEQLDTLKDNKDVWIESLTSLDFVYIALGQDPAVNKALANKAARQAIGHAIDYDGIIGSLLGGSAIRPASFLPIGTIGSTEEVTKKIGFRQDLDKAKKLLGEAGFPDGFEFELSYGNGSINGSTYNVIGQKVQGDLQRVGIQVKLNPMPQVNLRTLFTLGKTSATLVFWNPPAVESELWAAATVERLAKRTHWTPPDDIVQLVHRAASETDQKKQVALYEQYQQAMIEQANIIVLFQPIYRVGVRKTISKFPLTAAGWQLDMAGVALA